MHKGEDGSLIPHIINTLNPKREFMERSLMTYGLNEEITDESLKTLNGPVEKVLDTKSTFFINIIDGRVTRAQKL